jgi:hypothetical protein
VVAVCDHFARTTTESPAESGEILPVVITFADDISRLAAYRAHLGIDVPVLTDVDRVLYDLLGAGRASLAKVWNPGTLAMYGRLLVRGRRLRLPRDDTRQLGADALVGADGLLRHVWLPATPDARPSIAELAAEIETVE